ncbi:MAG: restriction endonuclease subunit S [Veillonella atypica]
MVWLLNLDMIKANTGEIVEKVYINRQNIPTSSISFKTGTVLYSKLRPYLNKVVIADGNGYGTSELIPLNSDKNGLTAEYLAYYLRQDSFVEYIKDKVTGAKMPRVAMDVLRNIDIVQPNYVYQEQFSSFVYQINKLKADVQKSIDEAQLLMDSLMQEYFG